MRSKIIAVLVVCGVLLGVYGVWLYLTHFYYERSEYTIGTKNEGGEVLHEVALKLFPAGQDMCGILDKGQEARHADPPWPVPERIIVTFNDDVGSRHELSLTTGLPKNFRGKLTVLINKTNNVFAANLEKTERKK